MRLQRGLPALRLRLRTLLRKSQVEQEMNDELQFHLDNQIEYHIAKGLTPIEARRAALLAMGGIEQRKEDIRDTRRVNFVEHLFQDLRHGLHALRKSPGFAVVAVLTIALGIGANATIFTLLDPILFRPLPYRDPGKLVRVYRTSPQSNSWPHSAPNFLDYRAQNRSFEHLAAFTWESFNLSEPGEQAERPQGLKVTAEFFPILGTLPALGRVFTAEEDTAVAEPVAVLSNRFWVGRFHGDRGVIGRAVRLNGRDTRIIGVMPDSFENPLFFGRVDLWTPMAFSDTQRQNRSTNYLNVVGRLRRDVSMAQAQSDIGALATRLRQEHGQGNLHESIRLENFKTSITPGTASEASLFTFGMTAFVLLIACVNLANLQLARITAGARNFAVRAALGGSRRRLIKQSMTESLLISMIGGAIALPASVASAQFIGRRALSEVPGAHLTFDYRFFVFAFLCSLVAGIVFGAVPAWLSSRTDLNQLLKDNPRFATASAPHRRLRHALIVAEVAFALVLLASTGAFVRGLTRVIRVDPGWRVDGVLIGRIGLDGPNYARLPLQTQFLARLRERLASLPGVQEAALSLSTPTWIYNSSSDIVPDTDEKPTLLVNNETVSPRYFEALGIPLKEGRSFTTDDKFGQPQVAVINEPMARRLWPNESAVGKRFVFGGDPQMRWLQIVGVAADVSFPSAMIQPDSAFTIYRPLAQSPSRGVRIELRTAGPPEAMIPSVRQAAAELDKDLPVFELRSARDLIHENVENLDLAGTLLAAFSLLGLALAAVGIFGVISYSVTQRTSEIGLRVALGAERRQVLWLVLKQGLSITLVGTVLGFGGATAATRILSAALPALPRGEAVTLLAMAALLLVVALLACYLPARRASRIDPISALRHE
jgi:putative ABC transport system permease protein